MLGEELGMNFGNYREKLEFRKLFEGLSICHLELLYFVDGERSLRFSKEFRFFFLKFGLILQNFWVQTTNQSSIPQKDQVPLSSPPIPSQKLKKETNSNYKISIRDSKKNYHLNKLVAADV